MKKICFLNIKHNFKLSTYASPCKGVTIQLDIQMLFIFTTSLSKFESISFCLNFSNIVSSEKWLFASVKQILNALENFGKIAGKHA